MNKLFTSFVVTALWFSFAVTSCVGSDVNVGGRYSGSRSNLSGLARTLRSLSSTSVEAPETTPGPRESYAFGYKYDNPNTTVADALRGLVADGIGLGIDFGGTARRRIWIVLLMQSRLVMTVTPQTLTWIVAFGSSLTVRLKLIRCCLQHHSIGISSLPLTD